MDNRICPECRTSNELEYAYCKNCGCKLIEDTAANGTKAQQGTDAPKTQPVMDNFAGRRPNDAAQGSAPVYQSAPQNSGNQTIDFDSVNDIPREEMAAFIGAKSREIYPKFCKMQLTQSKLGWCWPPALLGFGFGPLGAAIWFFYRKMYKIALILVAIGIITGGTAAFLNRDSFLLDNNKIETIIEENINENNFDFSGLIGDLSNNIGTESYIASAFTDVVDIATGIIVGIFSLYWYREFATRSIYKYRSCGIDPRYYSMGLSAIGGTSGGMVALGIAVLYIAQTLFDLIPNLI